jgi:hypothetical protein
MGAYRNVELNQMAVEGVPGKCFFVEEEGVPVYDELVYVAASDKLDAAEKDKISRFLSATEKAAQYIVNHPDKGYELFSSYSTELKDELNQRAWKDTVARFSRAPASAGSVMRPISRSTIWCPPSCRSKNSPSTSTRKGASHEPAAAALFIRTVHASSRRDAWRLEALYRA